MYARFKNREEAARELIKQLDRYGKEDGLVLAVPRGGVPIAYHIARAFNKPLDLLMSKKIGHPQNKEFAIGAVSLDDYIIDEGFDLPAGYIEEEVKQIRAALRENYRKFMGAHKPGSLKGKTVIVVDDGMATGNTMLSSVKMLKKQEPRSIVIAVPVASWQAIAKVRTVADDVVCLYTPEPLHGVGMHYEDFDQVEDEEVIRLLKEINHFEDVA